MRFLPFFSDSLRPLFLAAMVSLGVGCGAVDDAKDAAQTKLDELGDELGAHDFSGTLPLEWTSEKNGTRGPVRLVLVQDGLSVYGFAAFEGHPCLQELAIEADVTLEGLRGALVADDVRLPFELTLLGSGGPQKPSGVVEGISMMACLADEANVALRSR